MTPPPTLKGFITAADLPRAEQEWPGLQAFLGRLPPDQRPVTFLDLVWRFEEAVRAAASGIGGAAKVVQIQPSAGCRGRPGYLPHMR